MAQSDSASQTEFYFQFKAKRHYSGGSLRISVDFGQKYLATDSFTRQIMKSKIESLTQIEDVLEYMNGYGWKLVTTSCSSYHYFNTYYYVMRKEN